jgi:hypothetical protein
MLKMGVCHKMISVVKSTLDGATCYLHVEQEVREVKMKNGSGQGTSLGPVLFQFFFLPLISHWTSKWDHLSTVTLHSKNAPSTLHEETRTLGEIFADDLAALMKSLRDAEECADDLVNFLADFKCRVHVGTQDNPKSKSVVLFMPWNDEERQRHEGKALTLSGGKTIPCVESAVHLGHTITSSLSDAPHLRLRASKAAQAFGALGKNLMRSNHVWRKVKTIVFESMILPTLLDGVECCVLTQQALDELTTVYHRMVRASMHISPHTQRKWTLTSEVLLDRIGLKPLHHYVDLKILGYTGHVERMGPERRPKRIRDGALPGPKLSGGQYKTHQQTVEECANRKGLTEWKKLAVRKSEWRKSIRTSVLLRARTSVKPQQKFVGRWAEAPDSIIGRRIEKKFGAKWHGGKVTSTEVDIDTNENLWHVKHDDGDSEDFGSREIGVALLDTDDEGSESDSPDEGASCTEGASCVSNMPDPTQPKSPETDLRALLGPKFNARAATPTEGGK